MMCGLTVASKPDTFETVRTSNAAIFNRLGLTPALAPGGHHRKRLASPEPAASREAVRLHQSTYGRRHDEIANPRDSHVYIVKLPASPPYYTFSKPHKSPVKDGPNVTLANPNVGFHSNGRPAKIYHWNLPMVKKMNEKKRHQTQMKMDQMKKKFEAERERQKMASKLSLYKKKVQLVDDGEKIDLTSDRGQGHPAKSRNNDKRLNYPENLERVKVTDSQAKFKTYRLEDSSMSRIVQGHFPGWHAGASPNELHGSRNTQDGARPKAHRKKAAMSYYYAPLVTKSSSASIHKNFPGNGKPKAFYVMEKSRKPAYYHKLLP